MIECGQINPFREKVTTVQYRPQYVQDERTPSFTGANTKELLRRTSWISLDLSQDLGMDLSME